MKVTVTLNFACDPEGPWLTQDEAWGNLLAAHDGALVRIVMEDGERIQGCIVAGDSDSTDIVLATHKWPYEENSCARTIAVRLNRVKSLSVVKR